MLVIYLDSERSVLFPTRIMTTSFPLSARTSSSHFLVFLKESRTRSQWERDRHTGQIIDNDSNVRIANVTGNQTSKSPRTISTTERDLLLTSSIPKLETNSAVIQVHSLREKIDTNRSLSIKLQRNTIIPDKKNRRYRT